MFAILKVENDEMDIKNVVLEKDKYSLEQELRNNIDNLNKSKYKSNESIRELNEKVIMLENVVSKKIWKFIY